MTLTPETRVLLTDALRPPAGYGIDVAVGTTYSLDLTALLLAPLAFALEDRISGEELDKADPVRLLEAVRRYSERTTVFCQAGGIHVPQNYRSILTFVEDSVREVSAPKDGAIFHPKVWALRFVDETGEGYLHRGVILSRNMTFDRSWDTALVLDERPDGNIKAGPLAEFVQALPGLDTRGLEPERGATIEDLAATMRGVRFAAPSPFTGGQLLPIGLTRKKVWPFPPKARNLLAISPFITGAALNKLAGIAKERTLVSRMESLESVGAAALNGWNPHILHRLAEVESGSDPSDAHPAHHEFSGTAEGLHAKTYVVDLSGSTSHVVTGSANLTSSAWGNNVEFGAVLTGRTRDCGVEKVLDGTKDAPGLFRMLEPVTVSNQEAVTDPQSASTYEIEALHLALAKRGIMVEVKSTGKDTNEMTLKVDLEGLSVDSTFVRPISLVNSPGLALTSPDLRWTVSDQHVTPFFAIESTVGEGELRATRRCVLKAILTGDVADRRKNAITLVLSSKQDVLRYLVFLLGDPAYDALLAELSGADSISTWNVSARGTSLDLAIFEPLVRAVGRDEAALARIASTIQELSLADGGAALLPEDFDQLWNVVWSVHEERRK